jgi:hypothetical protein
LADLAAEPGGQNLVCERIMRLRRVREYQAANIIKAELHHGAAEPEDNSAIVVQQPRRYAD